MSRPTCDQSIEFGLVTVAASLCLARALPLAVIAAFHPLAQFLGAVALPRQSDERVQRRPAVTVASSDEGERRISGVRCGARTWLRGQQGTAFASARFFVVPVERIELPTFGLQNPGPSFSIKGLLNTTI
jgi:hypothetical protein